MAKDKKKKEKRKENKIEKENFKKDKKARRKAAKKRAKESRKRRENPTRQLVKLARRQLPQLLMQSFAIVLTAVGSFMLMTWIIRDLLDVKHIYASAGLELAGMLGFLTILLVPMITVLYRRRAREVVTLSEAIRKVAAGDYSTRIIEQKRAQMKPIYDDFNKMCAELESVKLLRNDFINSYSHEFKTPIASINGFASLVLEKDLPEDEQKEYLKIIVDESARLSNLATSSILLSKLTSQTIVTDIEEYDLGEQLRECSIILSGTWLKKNMNFDVSLESVMYSGNKEMMQHMWINLLDNAVKYTPEGGKITVLVREENGYAIVKIMDTGEGISKDIQKSLFDPYFQGDSSHSRQGLGLGLSIVKRIVELCKGTISVRSTLGEGSEFTVILPM
ncbi:MAG: HAMP domain-containing sensor histidine kinase [Bacillota bacterium]|nr:HAMP domain-containing sensor histidine kinase [Bacillota bacterium]